MSNFVLVHHKVKDYSQWKHGYESHRPKRAEAGLAEKYILRDADDPNDVTVLFDADNLDKAKRFAESADLRQTMEKYGVAGKPEIHYLHD